MAILMVSTANDFLADELAPVLEATGHTVVRTVDGPDTCIQAAALKADFVFLDAALPFMDGMETAKRLHEDPDVPDHMVVVLLTSAPPDTRQLEQTGIRFWLQPPLDATRLTDLIVNEMPPEGWLA